MLTPHDQTNFDTLTRAFNAGDVALLEVKRKEGGSLAAAICTVSADGGIYSLTPFAVMVEGNPFELFLPPDPEGGFVGDDT